MKKKVLPFLAAVLLLAPLKGTAQRLSGTSADPKFKAGATQEGGGGSGLYSPNPYTGTCDINVPIYSYATDYGNFGISLGYNTKGIRVDLLSSDVGLNWNINAGATITRIVRDLPDEVNVEADTFVYATNPWGGTVLDTATLNRFWRLKGKYATYTESAGSAADTLIYRDKECDEFQINLPTGSYTFSFGRNGNNYVHPAKGIKVETVFNGSVLTDVNTIQAGGTESANYMDFIVTDVQGNKFYFIRSDYSGKDVTDLYGYTQPIAFYWLTTQWVIQKAVLANGSVISYTYNDFSSAGIYSGNSYSREEHLTTIIDGFSSPEPNGTIKTKKLASIQYPNNVTAEFVYDASGNRADFPGRALREFKISSLGNCMRYKMDQAYFYSEGTFELPYGDATVITDKNKKTRLKLKGISILSCDGATEEPLYTFTYNTTVNLPQRGSLSQDFMGYFNGINNSVFPANTGIPAHTPMYATAGAYGSNRTQVYAQMKAGILTKITNGYGGSTEFFYGEHLALSSPLTAVPLDALYFGKDINDGFRVDSVIEKDTWHPDNSRVTVFQYSSGQRFLIGGRFDYPRTYRNSDGNLESKYFTGSYLTQHQFVQGANQGYSNVTVLTKTGTGQQLSKRVLTFTNFSDATSGFVPRYLFVGGGKHFYEFPYTDKRYIRDWEMGLLLTAADYDENNRIVMQTTNKYRFTLDTSSSIGNVENTRIAYTNLDVMVNHRIQLKAFSDYYRPYTGTAYLDTTITLKYVTDTRNIADTVWYQYDGHNNLNKMITRNSRGQKVRTVQVFNYDVNAIGGSTLFNINQAGIEKIVGTQRWLIGSTGFASDSLLNANINTFTYSGGKLLPKSTYLLVNAFPLSYSAYTGYSGGEALPYPNNNINAAFSGSTVTNFKETSDVLQADAKGNPLESQVNGQNQYLSMVWDTLTGNKLAEATNCRYADIGYNSFEYTDPGANASTLVTNGNFTYYANQIVDAGSLGAPTGKKIYKLTSSNNQDIVGSQNLVVGKEYIISFWCKGATPRLYNSGVAITLTTAMLQYTIASSSWKHYLVRFIPATSGKVKLSGPATATTMYFDEVRLFPSDAVMNSSTYEPVYGKSSTTDATGRITYYEYDKMGRQNVIRNQEGNVVSKTQYTINGAE